MHIYIWICLRKEGRRKRTSRDSVNKSLPAFSSRWGLGRGVHLPGNGIPAKALLLILLILPCTEQLGQSLHYAEVLPNTKKKGGARQDNCIWALEITPEHHVLCIGTPHAFLNAQITTVKMLLLAAGW